MASPLSKYSKVRKIAAVVFMATAPFSPAWVRGDDAMPSSLKGIEDLSALRDATMSGSVSGDANAGALRGNALRDAAETLGFQSGAKWRYQAINVQLESIATQLDELYDFRPLLMHSGRVRPPVIAEANNTETLLSDVESTASDATFEIVEDAKIVVSPPSWRDYLMQNYQVNDEINPVMRPKDNNEMEKWAADARRGWADGVTHADNMYQVNLNKLVHDFRGMLRFHRLSDQRMVDVPDYAEGNLGVTVNGKKLDVNQKLFQIASQAKFNQKEGDWRLLQ